MRPIHKHKNQIMKTTIICTALFLMASSVSGQSKVQSESFTKINIQGNAKIIIKQDSVCSVRYTGNDNPSDDMATISNGTLKIGGSPDNEMNISLPLLQELKISGRGSATGVSTFTGDEINIEIDGDGKIILDASVRKIDAQISGLGKIVLSGTAQETAFSIPGSGKIDALGLKTIKSNVNISGIGKCMVDVIDELSVDISGSGNVTYKTLPKKITKNITGMGNIKDVTDEKYTGNSRPDTTRIKIADKQIWIIGKKDSTHVKKNKAKPIWAGFEMGINSYMDNGGTFTLSSGKENFDLKTEKSISVGLNLFQKEVELGRSNIWLFTGLGITWNNYRFNNNVVLEKGSSTSARLDTTHGIVFKKSKLVSSYLTAPLMLEVFTSRTEKNAFHIGAGGIFGFRIGSHTKQKIEIDGKDSKIKDHDDFNLNPFRYGFRVAIGYGKFNLYADYYASTMFKNNKGPVLYPVNAGITFVGF